MSGFAGIVGTDGGSPDERLLQRMAESLRFRGPDGTSVRIVAGMGGCFTFLRTGPAPQEESQPYSLDGTTWLLGDVRLDGREKLREALREHGSGVSAEASCEELVLQAWRHWGKEGLARLEGDFAFAIWESNQKKLFCARDLIGPRPFFHAQIGSRFYFSNTLEAMRLAPDISSAVDPYFVRDFLLQGWCADADRTAYREIKRLLPGHLLKFSDGAAKTARFTALPIEEPLFLKHKEEYIEEFRARFRDTVMDRVPRDSVAIFLSGGMDSSSVAAQAVALSKEKWLTKVVAVNQDCRPLFADQEGMLAMRAAEYWGIPIETVSIEKEVPFGSWGDAAIRTPEPTGEPFQAMHVELYRRVAAHARVVLNGEGGDAILARQARTYLGYLLRRGRLGKIVKELGGYILKNRRLPYLRTGIRGKLRNWFGKDGIELAYPEWIAPEFEREMKVRERWMELNQPPERSQHPLYPEAYASLTSTYWSLLLEDEDAAWSGVPVETRSPFLDLRLIRFLLRVPPLPWCTQKELLREATRGILPEEIRLRPKVPLQEDPLPLLMERGTRSKLPLGEPSGKSSAYVNWPKVPATSSGDAGYVLVEKMRSFALDNWLKGVEKGRGIQ
jgi:asparagine synthase (glutamine-hydrolysing)